MLNDPILLLNMILAAATAILQAFDLHTTSEVLKHRAGKEGNDLLAPALNTDEPHARKFWRLVALKIAAMLGSIAIAWAAIKTPGIAPALAAVQIALAVFYVWIIWRNWKFYRAIR